MNTIELEEPLNNSNKLYYNIQITIDKQTIFLIIYLIILVISMYVLYLILINK